MKQSGLKEIAEKARQVSDEVTFFEGNAKGIWTGMSAPFSRCASIGDLKLLATKVNELALLIEGLAQHILENP